MSCLLRIRAARDEMSASEKRLADFILKNSALIRDYSSQQLAFSVGVSQSSVVKFSQKLGYKGFTDLKLAIHETVVRQDSGGPLPHEIEGGPAETESTAQKIYRAKCEVLANTGDLNDEEVITSAARMIERSQRIQVIAAGNATLISKDFAWKLMVLGYSVVAEVDSYIQLSAAATLGRGDLLFVISASGNARDLIHITRQVKKAGTTIVSLTSSSTSPIVALSDLRLHSISHNGWPDIPQIFEPSSQQHVVDLLFYRLVERNSNGRELLIRGQTALDNLTKSD
ncbi:MAG: MurR/RpiR family transcriptional regulator [Woeseia sp.]